MIPAEQPKSAAVDSFACDRTADYRHRLHPWCLVCELPQMQRLIVARFRKRNEAEESRRVFQRLNPDSHYQIMFEPPETTAAPLTSVNSLLNTNN